MCLMSSWLYTPLEFAVSVEKAGLSRNFKKVKPGSQCDTGALNIMSVMSIARKILMSCKYYACNINQFYPSIIPMLTTQCWFQCHIVNMA